MYLAEVLVPPATWMDDIRAEVAERVLVALTRHDEAPSQAEVNLRRSWHVIVHEPATWVTGHEGQAAVIRIAAPAMSMMTDEGRAEVIARVTGPVMDMLGADAHVTVHLSEHPDGTVGLDGQVVHEADVVRTVIGDAPVQTEQAIRAGDATATDPVCGMSVSLEDSPITLQHGDDAYAFCCEGCRDVFAERLAAS